jgi:cobalt/nickel transport system permease protein
MLIFTGITFFKALQLLCIPIAFILVGCLTLSFNMQFDQGLPTLVWSKSQFDLAVTVFLRSAALVSIIYFWLLTNSIAEISGVLRKLRVPFLFIELFILSYKFIFFGIHLSLSLYQSQKSRLGWSYCRTLGKDAGYLANQVFIQSWCLAKRFMDSLDSRMYDGKIASLSPKPLKVRESIFIHTVLSILVIVFFLTTS